MSGLSGDLSMVLPGMLVEKRERVTVLCHSNTRRATQFKANNAVGVGLKFGTMNGMNIAVRCVDAANLASSSPIRASVTLKKGGYNVLQLVEGLFEEQI